MYLLRQAAIHIHAGQHPAGPASDTIGPLLTNIQDELHRLLPRQTILLWAKLVHQSCCALEHLHPRPYPLGDLGRPLLSAVCNHLTALWQLADADLLLHAIRMVAGLKMLCSHLFHKLVQQVGPGASVIVIGEVGLNILHEV